MDNIKFARKCSICDSGMNEGYIVNEGEEYYCSSICLYYNYSPVEWDEMYTNNDSYWTQWEDKDDYEYELINGILTEIE